jgi:RHS repeat-associated protein
MNGTTQVWKQTYSYDRFGNRTFDAAHTTLPSPLTNPAINAANNRIADNQGYGYDLAGNLTTMPGLVMSYDAENHQVSANDGQSFGVSTYAYDGDGRRVRKVTATGSATTIFVYNAMGQMVAEYESNPAQGNGGTSYLTSDNLGTPRVITDSSGGVQARHDYLPFGEEIGLVGGRTELQKYVVDNVRQKFTQKERDVETGLDYFLARYYSSTQGRFTGVDLAGPDLANPQTLNKYQYCLNNPLRYIDRNGLYEEDVHRDLTYALALAAGFNSTSAYAIASANQWVDDNPETSPMGMSPWGKAVRTRESYHFTNEGRRQTMWMRFYDSKSLQDLGTFLHAEQDAYSHWGYGPKWGHFFSGHEPDKTDNDPDKADRMAENTFNTLSTALHKVLNGVFRQREPNSYNAVDWKSISPLVKSFNRAKTPEEKRKIVEQITAEVQRQHVAQDIARDAADAVRHINGLQPRNRKRE